MTENHTENTSPFLNVCVTGAAGQIAYSLIPHIANGSIFGHNQKINLSLLDIEPMMAKLKGVEMEINDCGKNVIQRILCTSKPEKAFDKADYVIMVGGFPRKKGMDRKDLLAKNRPIFESAGKFLGKFANPSVKVLVVANPANTNALVLFKNSGLPQKQVTALTRLDQNRAVGFLARAANVGTECVKDVFIWGNHSKTQVPDWTKSTINGKLCDLEVLHFNEIEMAEKVQMRGAQVIEARGLSSAMSAAQGICDHLRDWHHGTKFITSMSTFSNGNPFGVKEGIFFSFPVIVENGEWKFAEGISVPSHLIEKIQITEKELMAEKTDCGL